MSKIIDYVEDVFVLTLFRNELDNQFITAVGNKNFDRVLQLAKRYNRLLLLKRRDTLPYLFIIIEFIDVVQFTDLIQNLDTCISYIKDKDNTNILQYATFKCAIDIANHLITNASKYHLNVNYKDDLGLTALHYALQQKEAIDTIKLLVNHPNIDINKQLKGFTSLHLAIRLNYIEAVNIILKHPNVDINLKDSDGGTPLHCAVLVNKDAIRTLLRNTNIDVNFKNNLGNTPLRLAVSKNDIETIKLLLEHPNLNINLQNNHGNPPIHLASHCGYVEAVTLLLKYPNININMQDDDGDTPLHDATFENHKDVVRILLQEPNIDLYKNNKENKSPYDIAVEKNHFVIAEFLKHKSESLKTQACPTTQEIAENLDSNQIEDQIKKQEQETKKLKIKLKIKKREEQLQETQQKQKQTLGDIKKIEFELEVLNTKKDIIKERQRKNDQIMIGINEDMKIKERDLGKLLTNGLILDTTEIENEIKKLKERLLRCSNNKEENTGDDECPICFECMLDKRIYQCTQGHHYCEECKPKLTKCPTCREDLSNSEIRSRVLEQIIARTS